MTTHLYLQCQDEDSKLLLVDKKLFTSTGGLPSHSWFIKTFGGEQFALPAALSTHATTGFPIYYIMIPYVVMTEMLRLMRLPLLLQDAHRAVPVALRNVISLVDWKAYLEYYGLLPLQVRVSKDQVREKAKQMLATYDDDLNFTHTRRIAETFVAELKAKHPEYSGYKNGSISELQCDLINTYNGNAENWTYEIRVGDDPAVGPIKLAWYIAFSLKGDGSTIDDISYAGAPKVTYFNICVARAMDEDVQVAVAMRLSRKSKAKTYVLTEKWPAGIHNLKPGDYDCVRLTITRTKLGDIGFMNRIWRKLEKEAQRLLETGDDDDDDSSSDS